MKCSIRAFIILSVAIASVHSYGPPRQRPMRRSPPPQRHMIVSRRDPAYIPGPPYSKRPMSNMMISHPGSRPSKHPSSLSGHYSKYSPIFKYPPPPQSRPFSYGPPKKTFYPRPYPPQSKYPYYGKHPGYPTKQRPKIPYEPDIPNETIATFNNAPSNHAPQAFHNMNYNKGGAKVPTITYGSPSIASKPYNFYGSSEEDASSEEVVQGSHQVSASIKYGKNTPGNGPAHPSILDPMTNIKYPGPSFKFPQHTAESNSNNYQTITPTQATQYTNENTQVKYPSSEGSQSSTYRRRRPQRQDASKATQAVTSRPYSTSNVKFPAATNSEGTSSSYQNYDHFLQETFAPDLGAGSNQQTPAAAAENPTYTRQKKKDRSKSRYRNPNKHYEVKDEPEERGDTYDDIETVEADYEGWQPTDSKK